MSYTKVHSVCAWSNSEIGYTSCSLTVFVKMVVCAYVKHGLLAINFPFFKENSYTDASISV